MRFLLNLSVGRKLAASAAIAMLLLGGLVSLVWVETGIMLQAQRDQAVSEEARERLEAATDKLAEVAVLERDLLLTPDAEGQGPARDRMLSRLR